MNNLKAALSAALVLLALSLTVTALPVGSDEDSAASVRCGVCKSAITSLLPLFRSNKTLDRIEAVATEVCYHVRGAGFCKGKKACHDLCPGIVRNYGPAVVSVLLQNGRVGATDLCQMAKLCPEEHPSQPVPLPTPSELKIRSNLSNLAGEKEWPQWGRKGEGVGSFIQLTDVHLDVQYMPGANAECGEPTCCRARNGSPAVKGGRAAGRFGDYHCDTSPEMASSLWNTLNGTFAPYIDFAVLTGDEPTHDVWMQSKTHNLAAIDTVSAGLLEALSGVPSFPCIGNHANYPADLFQGGVADNWLYNAVAEDWRHWLSDDALSTLRQGGYYAARARPNLWILAMHTSILSSDDLYLRRDAIPQDLNHQLPWLADTLTQVMARGDKCFIIGHARPTTFIEPLRSQYYEIVKNFDSVIIGQLFGHAHPAELSLLRMADDQPPFAVAYAAASVTTFTDLNPGFREWQFQRAFDSVSGNASASSLLTGWREYWVDLVEANKHTPPPQWEKRYEAPSFFNMSSLSPQEWEKFAIRLNHDSDALSKFYWTWAKGGPAVPPKSHYAACDILQTKNCAKV